MNASKPKDGQKNHHQHELSASLRYFRIIKIHKLEVLKVIKMVVRQCSYYSCII